MFIPLNYSKRRWMQTVGRTKIHLLVVVVRNNKRFTGHLTGNMQVRETLNDSKEHHTRATTRNIFSNLVQNYPSHLRLADSVMKNFTAGIDHHALPPRI